MPGGIGSFMFLWHVPIIVALAVMWVFGGGYMLWRMLHANYDRRRATKSRFFAISLGMWASGAVAGAVVSTLFNAVGNAMDARLAIPGAIAAGVAGIVMSLVIAYVFLNLPLRRALKPWALTIGALVLVTGIVSTPVGIATIYQRRFEMNRLKCQINLRQIDTAIRDHYFLRMGPDTLDVLVQREFLNKQNIRCPATSDGGGKYFYMPMPSVNVNPNPARNPKDRIRACDLKDWHKGGRIVLLNSGKVSWETEASFAELLAKPENLEFAKELKKVDNP